MKKTLISNIEVIKETVNDFKNTLMKYLFFEVSYKLLTSSVLIPFLIFTFRRFINLYGISGLTNSQILNFALSLKGFLVIGIVSLMALIIIFVEISVLVIISQKSYFNKSISVSDALRTSFRRIPYIIGAGTIPVILFLLILIPFGGLGLGASFFESVPLPKFIEGEIYNSIKYTMLYICSAVFLAFILTKFVFIFHCIIIERLSITKAIKRSSEIAKGMRRKIIAITLGWNLFLAAVMFLLLAIAAGVMLLISFLFKLNMSITNIELNLVNFGGVVLFIFSFLAAPSNISIITKVYYFQRNKIDGIVQDELNTEKKKKKIDTIESRVYNYLKGHRNILVLFMAAVVVVTTALGSYFAEEVYFNIKKVKLISHRGITEREPENSLSAIKASIEHNLNYAEIDVQMTKDGVVVLMHDETLKRLAGINKKVRDINYNELKNIDIGMSYPAEFRGEKIITLEEAIEASRGKIKLLIEFKSYGSGDDLVRAVVDIIEEEDFVDECLIQSLSYKELELVKAINPNIITGYVVYLTLGDLTALNVDFYTIEQTIITKKLVKSIHRSKKEVFAWTVNDEEDMESVLNLNVDGIITDRPKLLKEVIKNEMK